MKMTTINVYWTAFLDPDVFTFVTQYCDAVSLADQLRSRRQVVEIAAGSVSEPHSISHQQLIKDFFDSHNIPFDDGGEIASHWTGNLSFPGQQLQSMQDYFGETSH